MPKSRTAQVDIKLRRHVLPLSGNVMKTAVSWHGAFARVLQCFNVILNVYHEEAKTAMPVAS